MLEKIVSILERIAAALEKIAIGTLAPQVTVTPAETPPATTAAAPAPKTRAAKALATALNTPTTPAPAAAEPDAFADEPVAKVYTKDEVRAILQAAAKKHTQEKAVATMKDATGQDTFPKVTSEQYPALVKAIQALG